ncbi:hypothetical protein [Amycolatopsis sp. EV170708-02-1]|uniref:hypothetical protein n=1 Tax=Amycolatopsis sp. EV170708-02-1 TaxID=2919322 RepID=UPI001F0CBA8F|nr:hypothetical protein [Amycolatopsis sp. EV170708-02-1]UMP07029.1 hypothetical protein MJQ72_20420 [Amycolatopsis sp. EV170708-02-1]
MPHPDRRVAALIDANPHLDTDELVAAFELCGEARGQVQPYEAAERHAHDLVGAWLAHTGARHYRGDRDLPSQNHNSREAFLRAAGIDRGVVDEEGQPEAVLPLQVLIELLEDMTLHLATADGAPLDRHQGYVRHRLTMDAAYRAYHGQ